MSKQAKTLAEVGKNWVRLL